MSQASVNVQLSAVLTDNTGVPVGGAPIQFQFKLTSAATYSVGGTVTTDANGSAVLTLQSLVAPAMYDFLATFNGTMVYAASTVHIAFDTTVTILQTQLSVQVTPVSGSTANVTGNLSSSSGPVSGAAISVSVDGATVGSAATDVNGGYGFQLTNITPGMHTVTVAYAGSVNLAPAHASSSFGGPAPPSGGGGIGPIVAGAVVGAVVVAGAFSFVTRGKGKRRKKR